MTNSNETALAELGAIEPAAKLELLGVSDQQSAVCATLTPAIKARLQELRSGQILLVSVDDPSARVDVPAWCALTGNALYSATQGEGGVVHFLIRKK